MIQATDRVQSLYSVVFHLQLVDSPYTVPSPPPHLVFTTESTRGGGGGFFFLFLFRCHYKRFPSNVRPRTYTFISCRKTLHGINVSYYSVLVLCTGRCIGREMTWCPSQSTIFDCRFLLVSFQDWSILSATSHSSVSRLNLDLSKNEVIQILTDYTFLKFGGRKDPWTTSVEVFPTMILRKSIQQVITN